MPQLQTENAGAVDIYFEDSAEDSAEDSGEGRGDGAPLVLVGGITSSADVWQPLLPALSERHRVVTFDNRGTGRTKLSNDDGIRTPTRFADDVLALIDGLGFEQIHLAGASMGGMIVQEFALRYPDRLRSLSILCSTFGGANSLPASAEVMSAMFNGAKSDASEEEKSASLATQIHPDSLAKRPDRIAFYVGTKKAHPHSFEELARRAAGLASFDVYDRLADLDLPTLILAGSDDVLIPTENSRLLAKRIRGAQLELIEDAGHVFWIEQPQAASAALLRFIDGIA